MTKKTVALATAALTLLSASAVFAQGTMGGGTMAGKGKMSHGKMMHGKKMAMKTVYACTLCKQYYTPTQAKKMHYKDPMGHKLTKMAKVPAGYTMGGNMSGMSGGKMMHGKMGGAKGKM